MCYNARVHFITDNMKCNKLMTMVKPVVCY